MGKHYADKTSVHVDDSKVAPPSSSWMPSSSVSELIEATNLSSTGISEVLNAKSPMDAAVQTITHPVVLGVVVVGAMLLLARR
jgi:hypothetical protein